MPDKVIHASAPFSTLREVLSRRGRRVGLATRNVATADPGTKRAQQQRQQQQHVIGTSAVEEALAIASQQTYHDKKYRLVLGSRRLDVPRRGPVPRQVPRRRKPWERPPEADAQASLSVASRLPAVWKTSTLPPVKYNPGNLSTVSVRQKPWSSPWKGYRGACHQRHIPASRAQEFRRLGSPEADTDDRVGWGRKADLAPATQRVIQVRRNGRQGGTNDRPHDSGSASPEARNLYRGLEDVHENGRQSNDAATRRLVPATDNDGDDKSGTTSQPGDAAGPNATP